MTLPHENLIKFLNSTGRSYQMAHHDPCRTSAESAMARAAAGFPNATGAKALIVVPEKTKGFNLIVIPGPNRLNSKIVRRMIGNFRFATPPEVAEATSGLVAGTIPPFASPVLPGIQKLFVDSQLKSHPFLGFNAACLTTSIVITCSDYMAICGGDVVEDFSTPPSAT